jgi:S1-C subfamily serine protease
VEPTAAASGLNPVDLAAVAIVIVAFILGLRSGFFSQLGGLLGAVAGGAVVLIGLPFFSEQLQSMDPPIRALIVVAGFIFAIGLGEALGSAAGVNVRSRLGDGFLGSVDRAGGAFLGSAQGILVIWLAGSILAAGAIPPAAAMAQTSIVVRALADALPPPTEFVGSLGKLLDASGLPQVFAGLEPFPAPPVETPSGAAARALTAVAAGSTVKVVTAACGYELTGTGFSIGDGYYVTNAHVVAGGDKETVVQDNGKPARATVVLFDASLDVAVLWAAGLPTPPLEFAAKDPRAGVKGAALGHPLGKALTVIPAGVASSYPAVGRDIYGTKDVTRQILELTANIEKGDSGGPLILPDGTVGGLVFAEAKSDPNVGYALSPVAVATRTMPAVGRTKAVATGACVR